MNHPRQRLRIVTATSLFDGHDAAINIMRRILQSKGVEVIHLGHNRSVHEIAEAAIEEDVQAIAITSYQGGHIEFFKYLRDLLDESGCSHIRIFGGGGGTILPTEIKWLQEHGISRIYSPDDGRAMGLEGMIDEVIRETEKTIQSDNSIFWSAEKNWNGQLPLGEYKEIRRIARAITHAENGEAIIDYRLSVNDDRPTANRQPPTIIGITGTGGAGKSSVTDEIVRRFLNGFSKKTIAVISVDPSKKKTGGALLGDRIRMNSIHSPRAYMRSLATRETDVALSAYVREALDICRAAEFDLILLESAGTGQSDASIMNFCDVSVYVMTPEYGAASQLEKINMLDYADIVVINKSDKPGAADALIEVRKQYKRNHAKWNARDEEIPVVATTASLFNDAGTQDLFMRLIKLADHHSGTHFLSELRHQEPNGHWEKSIIPPARVRYLGEIHESIAEYNKLVEDQSAIASVLYKLSGALDELKKENTNQTLLKELEKRIQHFEELLTPISRKLIKNWPDKIKSYEADEYIYHVRNQEIRQSLYTTSLSGTRIPKLLLPKYKDWGDILRWQAQENVPGSFPFTAGSFPLKREAEDPTRMFAGEGSPERTNKRFHYLSASQNFKRLSTAFDSVTLYGEDPDQRPDIYGKVGNSGVSVCTVDDAKKLYSGFDLCDPETSVSMTINGPAPMILAFFLNAAIDQQCEKYITAKGMWNEVNEMLLKKYCQIQKHPCIRMPNLPDLPETNNGLGLKLLGISGDDVLPKDIYRGAKNKSTSPSTRHGAGRYS